MEIAESQHESGIVLSRVVPKEGSQLLYCLSVHRLPCLDIGRALLCIYVLGEFCKYLAKIFVCFVVEELVIIRPPHGGIKVPPLLICKLWVKLQGLFVFLSGLFFLARLVTAPGTPAVEVGVQGVFFNGLLERTYGLAVLFLIVLLPGVLLGLGEKRPFNGGGAYVGTDQVRVEFFCLTKGIAGVLVVT